MIGGEESVLDMEQRLFVKIAVLRGAESARPSQLKLAEKKGGESYYLFPEAGMQSKKI